VIVSRDTTIAFLIFGSIFNSELMVLKCLLLRRSLDFTAEFPLNVPPNFLASCTSPEAVFEPIGVGETDDEKG